MRALFMVVGFVVVASVQQGPGPAAAELQRMVTAAITSASTTLTIKGGTYYFHDSNFEIFGARNLSILAPEAVTLFFGGANGINITNSEDLSIGNWTIDNEVYYTDKQISAHKPKKQKIITLNLLNCTRVTVTDTIIRRGYNMILTAFNGGGDHKFTRVKFDSNLSRLNRDAIHFSDQRVGPTIVDSVIGYTGDDLFNIHTTLMVVVTCDTPTSCIMVNPHLHGPDMMNTVYHTNCVMENVLPGKDKMSFFRWPTAAFETQRYTTTVDSTGTGTSTDKPDSDPDSLTVSGVRRVLDAALLAEAASLVPELTGPKLNPVSMTNVTVGWHAWDVWRVEFSSPVPRGVGRTALVQIDTISNSGTTIRNSLLTDTNCNLGRFKSSHSVIEGNTFRNADIPSLELSWLPQFFEGPVILSNVTVANNVIEGEGGVPVHCGPFCGSQTCLYGAGDQPTGTWSKAGCPECRDCYEGDTPWTKAIRLVNNTITALRESSVVVAQDKAAAPPVYPTHSRHSANLGSGS
jgi:hypothetical protein